MRFIKALVWDDPEQRVLQQLNASNLYPVRYVFSHIHDTPSPENPVGRVVEQVRMQVGRAIDELN